MYIYLLHFSKPIRGSKRHYVGMAKDLHKRMVQHLNGNGAKLLRQLKAEGGTFVVVRVWEGDQWTEKAIKAQRNHKRLCPICNGADYIHDGVEA